MSSEGVRNPGFELDQELELDNVKAREEDGGSSDRNREQKRTAFEDDGDRSNNNLEDCGLFGLSLASLNVFRNPKWCLVFLCWAGFTQGGSPRYTGTTNGYGHRYGIKK